MTTSSNSTEGGTPSSEPALGRIVFHSLCSAACAVVPVPFLDDHLVKLTRRRMVREMTAKRGEQLQPGELAILSGTDPKPLGWGCFLGVAFTMAFKIIVKVLRRLFRTILFWLLIKDAADAASKTFHEGYLIGAVLDQEWRSPEARERSSSEQKNALTAEVASRLRAPVDGVLDRVDTRALNHAFRGVLSGSRRVFLGIARTLGKLSGLRSEADDGEELLEQELEAAIPSSLVDRVATSLSQQTDYLQHLDELLAEQLFLNRAPEDRIDA